MFLCPSCKTPLSPTRAKNLPYFFCPRCKGRALTESSFRRALRKDVVEQMRNWQASDKVATKRPCPSCKTLMATIPVAQRLVIDFCSTCSFFWFDATEFERFPLDPHPMSEEETSAMSVRLEAVDHPMQAIITDVLEGIPSLEDSGEGEQFKTTSPLYTILITLLCFVFAVMSRANPKLIVLMAFYTGQPLRYLGLNFVSYLFIHADIFHLMGNVLFMWIFGSALEERVDTNDFLQIVFVSGITSALAESIFTYRHPHLLIGLSGAISGVMVALAMMNPRTRIVFRYFLGPLNWIAPNQLTTLRFSFPVWLFVVFWIAQQLVFIAAGLEELSGIAYIGHIGGIFGGMLVASRIKA